MDPLSPELEAEKQELIAEIHRVFVGVSRHGGVSWSETRVLDDRGSEEERIAARKLDRDGSWHDVLNDPAWNPEMGVGGWAYLDPIGFRYYLPVGMISVLNRDADIVFWFELISDKRADIRSHRLEQWSLLDDAQRACVRRFLLFEIEAARFKEQNFELEAYKHTYKDAEDYEKLKRGYESMYAMKREDWQRALESYWKDA